jgi:hypothetical protein
MAAGAWYMFGANRPATEAPNATALSASLSIVVLPGLAFAVDHLDRLVEAVADRDEAGQGRGSQLDVASVPENTQSLTSWT